MTPYMALHHHCLPLTSLTPSLPTALIYETPVIELHKNTVRDTYRSLEEKVNRLYIEIAAMLILRQSGKDATLQQSPCDHNSETAKLTEEMALYRHHLKIAAHNKNLWCLIGATSKYQINMCEALKITQQIICIYLHLINTKNYQIMMTLKTRVILGIM